MIVNGYPDRRTVWPTMFGFQFLVTCRPLPGVKQVLSQSERHLRGDEMISAATLDREAEPVAK